MWYVVAILPFTELSQNNFWNSFRKDWVKPALQLENFVLNVHLRTERQIYSQAVGIFF